jgi:hypothetical protein
VAGHYTVTIRNGPRVHRERFGSLEQALRALRARMERLSELRRPPVDLKLERFEPQAQVAVRGEIAGPGLFSRIRGGVDVRGDGSVEAYTGRVTRRLVEQRADETPYDALGRALEDERG